MGPRPRSDAAELDVWSGSTLFDESTLFSESKHKVIDKNRILTHLAYIDNVKNRVLFWAEMHDAIAAPFYVVILPNNMYPWR